MDKNETRELYQTLRVVLENQQAIMNFLAVQNHTINVPDQYIRARGKLNMQTGTTESALREVQRIIAQS